MPTTVSLGSTNITLNDSTSSSDNDYNPSLSVDTSYRENFGLTTDRLKNQKYFNVFKLYNSVDPLTSGIAYIFMTRPCCNLSEDNIQKDTFFQYLYSKGIWDTLAASLSDPKDTTTESGSNFIFPITNFVTSFDTKDLVLSTSTVGDNLYGQSIKVGNNLRESESADSFSINYIETENLYMTLLHMVWVRYIAMVRYGKFKPAENAILNKEIDYMSSLYYILTKVDGSTILYWCKYTGVFPTSVPLGTLSWRMGDNSIKNISINYDYSFKEDFDSMILLSDFNRVACESVTSTADDEDVSTGISGKKLSQNWCSRVWVSLEQSETDTVEKIYYKLNFA